MFQHKRRVFLLNVISLIIAGITLVSLQSYLQYKQNEPLCAICPNMATSGRDMISNTPKDDFSAVPFLDGKPLDRTEVIPATKVETMEGARIADDSQFELQISVSKQWMESEKKSIIGAQYDVIFYNNSGRDLRNWNIRIAIPPSSRLDSYWSGEFSMENDIMTVLPMDYNATILAGDDITFGFVLMTKGAVCHIEDCAITFYQEYKCLQHPLFWAVIVFLVAVLIADIVYVVTSIKTRKYLERRLADKRIIDQSLRTFANIIDAKDMYTKGHSIRVAIYSKEIARRMGMSEETQEQLYYIALLHDIGKIGISDSILQKPGQLTPEERQLVQQHVTIGGEVLKDFTSIPGIAEGAMYHHERFDGTGYAKGLSGESIPLFARIICVADAFDAMSSARCYRKKLDISVIVEELKNHAGTQFDPAITPYMLEMIYDKTAPVSITGLEGF